MIPHAWGHECDDADDAKVANAYGRWADRLYLSFAALFLPVAIGDLVVWMTGGSLMSLLGPTALFCLCIAYLDKRRRFRRSVRAGGSRSRPGAGRWEQPDLHPL
ncbi:MAG TPA: hypothetical protein VIC86_03420 [Acidimicrobiales bacterium]|jgi:hypothetical protein